MKKIIFILPIIGLIIFFACSKDSSKSYEYWNEQVTAKAQEINKRLESVPCTNIVEFVVVRRAC
jgi:hypothetical protein